MTENAPESEPSRAGARGSSVVSDPAPAPAAATAGSAETAPADASTSGPVTEAAEVAAVPADQEEPSTAAATETAQSVPAADSPATVAPAASIQSVDSGNGNAATTSTETTGSTSSTGAAKLPAVLATAVDQLSTAVTNAVTQMLQALAGTPLAPAAEAANWLLLAFTRRELTGPAATTDAADTVDTSQSTATAAAPLLKLNGYNVVPASQQFVTSFYGPWTNFPGYPGIQGPQQFDLVDPSTNETVGSFTAQVSYDRSLSFFGLTTTQMVVTEVESGTAGTGAGDVPPVGSIITVTGNGFDYGNLYTAMPTVNGTKISYKLLTPFGSIPLFTPFDAAKGNTDYGTVNRPLDIGAGLSIAPQTPSSMVFTGITGLAPIFTAVQGTQTYDVTDADGNVVGSFDALVTVTSDVAIFHTKLIYVTDTLGSTNVGTGAGQVPPVGTVYNVIYVGGEKIYALYTGTPSPSGDVNSTKLVTPLGSIPLPFNFNANTPPTVKPLQVPGGYRLAPTSDLQLVGANDLPPRDMIIQGYQQFDIIDANGNTIGKVDADVSKQWDLAGIVVTSVLVTKVTEGQAGTGVGDVPPVGSVFVFQDPTFGLRTFYSSLPTSSDSAVITYELVTPFGTVPMFLPLNMSAGLSDVIFYDPYAELSELLSTDSIAV